MDTKINHSPEYFLNEEEYLRKIYEEFRKETKALEKYTLLIISGIWSWCVANNTSQFFYYLTWLPIIIVNIMGIRAFGIYMQMRTIKKYLFILESSIDGMPKELGWEKYLMSDPLRAIWPLTAFVFWITINIVSIIVPFIYSNNIIQ